MIDIAVLVVDLENLERFQETGFSCMKITGIQQGGMTIE